MSLSINTNATSLSVQRSFNSATTDMNKAMERMSTGFKINSASDNAAGYSVSKKMESIDWFCLSARSKTILTCVRFFE